MEVTEFLDSYYQHLTIVECLLAGVLNLVAVPLSIHTSKYTLGSFKIIMLVFSANNMFHILADVFILPRYYFQLHMFSVYTSGPLRHLGTAPATLGGVWACVISVLQIYLEAVHFLYRYVVLCRSEYSHLLSVKNVCRILFISYLIYFIAFSLIFSYLTPYDDEIYEVIGNKSLVRLGIPARELRGVVFYYMKKTPEGELIFNWKGCLAVSCIMACNSVVIASMLYTGQQIHYLSARLAAAGAMSQITLEMNKTLFKMLIAQTVVPLLFLHAPCGVDLLGPFGWEVGRAGELLVIAVISYSVFEPLIVVYFLSWKRIKRSLLAGGVSTLFGTASRVSTVLTDVVRPSKRICQLINTRRGVPHQQSAKYGMMSVLPQQFFPLMPTLPFHFYLQNTPLAIMEKLSVSVENTPLLTAVLDQELHTSATKAIEPSKNRYGRPYISGRPLLTCDRKKIVELFEGGMKKIRIAQRLGITHSCVSKVLRRYKETGMVKARVCRTASCACPGSVDQHDVRYCRHLQKKASESSSERAEEARIRLPFTIDNILQHQRGYVYYFKLTYSCFPTSPGGPVKTGCCLPLDVTIIPISPDFTNGNMTFTYDNTVCPELAILTCSRTDPAQEVMAAIRVNMDGFLAIENNTASYTASCNQANQWQVIDPSTGTLAVVSNLECLLTTVPG